jgi:acyl dehydratase
LFVAQAWLLGGFLMSIGVAVGAYISQYWTPGLAVQLMMACPLPGVTVNPLGGGAEPPAPPPQPATIRARTRASTMRQSESFNMFKLFLFNPD